MTLRLGRPWQELDTDRTSTSEDSSRAKANSHLDGPVPFEDQNVQGSIPLLTAQVCFSRCWSLPGAQRQTQSWPQSSVASRYQAAGDMAMKSCGDTAGARKFALRSEPGLRATESFWCWQGFPGEVRVQGSHLKE